jgi:hypothetical protein
MQCQRGCKQKGLHVVECMVNDCWGCLPQLATAGWLVCGRCGDKLMNGLEHVLNSWGSLDERLARAGGNALAERVSGTATIGLVLDEGVLAVKDQVREWVVFAVRILVTEFAVMAPPSQTTPDLLKVCLRHSHKLLSHDLASDFVGDVSRLAFTVGQVVSPVRRSKFSLESAKCVQCESSVSVSARRGQVSVVCKGEAKHVMSFEQITMQPSPESSAELTSKDVSILLGKDITQVGAYAARYGWQNVGIAGSPRYRFADVRSFIEKKAS